MDSIKKLGLIIAIALSFGFLSGCEQKQETAVRDYSIPVHTLTVHPTTEPYWIDVFGQTEGNKAVLIHPQVTGPVLQRNYEEGTHVKKGDVLFTIDPAPFAAAYQSAQAATLQAEVALEKAEREAKRYADLNKAKAVSQKEYTDAITELKTCQANLDAARAQEQEAKITLDYTQVRSPVDGIAGRALINPGTLVTANQTQLTDVTQKRDMKVRFSLSENDLAGYRVTADSPVELVGEKFDKPVKAKINFTATQIDPTTGTRSLSATLDDTKGVFPGQFVTVRLTLGNQDNVYLVPQTAVRQLPDGTYSVYVLRDGKARATPVKVGQWLDTDWIITGGLKDGDQVIVTNIQRLKDKAPVTVNQEKENAESV
ncbi:MAG: efflux RND transporter periplasmic adaptor subunit [Burkholderiales bacterium]|nr:efflux RND transporter periplasmic adaptor subunit [Burkholderiales bacterium]